METFSLKPKCVKCTSDIITTTYENHTQEIKTGWLLSSNYIISRHEYLVRKCTDCGYIWNEHPADYEE